MTPGAPAGVAREKGRSSRSGRLYPFFDYTTRPVARREIQYLTEQP
jgi:hypothetical protein